MSREFAKSKASVLLDLVRGLAALLVLGEHWRNIFFVDYAQLGPHRAAFALPYVITATGHQAVVIFFVLSGYLISGSVFRMIQRNAWSWRLYLMHRLLRLWIVLIPGLLLCALWDAVGIHAHLAPLLYSGGVGNHMVPDVIAVHTVKAFFQNLAFLQTITGPIFGSDTALWSLAYEFWYYLLFPLGLFVVLPKVPVRVRIVCGVLFLLTAWFVGERIRENFPIWLLGTALALAPAPRFSNKIRIAAGVAFTGMYFAFAKIEAVEAVMRHVTPLMLDYILGLGTVLFLWVMLSASAPSEGTTGEHVTREISRFSYTLYVAHTPLCVLLAALLVGDSRWMPDALHILMGLGVLAVLLAYSYGVAYVTEFRTDPVRRFLEARLGVVDKRKLVAVTGAASK